MYTQNDDSTPIRFPQGSQLVTAKRKPVATASRAARERARRAMPGASILARLVDDPAHAPDWLQVCAAALESAGQPGRALRTRLFDVTDLLAQVDRIYATRLAEVQQWFDSPAAAGRTLHATLPLWTERLLSEAGALIRGELLPELAVGDAQILPVVQTDEAQRAWLHRYFMQHIYPLLTPLAVDPGRPFPFISSDSLNLLVELRRPETAHETRTTLFARVKIPSTAARLVAIPPQTTASAPGAKESPHATRYVYSADLVRFFVHHLFTGVPVRHVYLFRVVRGDTAWPGAGRRAARRQRRQEDQPVVRVDVERRMAEPVLGWLAEHLQAPVHGVVHHDHLLELTYLPAVARLVESVTAGLRR